LDKDRGQNRKIEKKNAAGFNLPHLVLTTGASPHLDNLVDACQGKCYNINGIVNPLL